MRGIWKGRRVSAFAIMLATGVAVAGAGMSAEPAYAQGKKDQGNSPAFVAAAQPLLDKLTAAVAAQDRASKGDAAAKAQVDAAMVGAPAMLAQAEAAAKTPRDKLTAGQMAMQIGVLTNNVALVQRGGRAMLDSKQLDGAQAAQIQRTLQQLSAVPARDTVLDQVNALAQANNPRGALAEVRKGVAARPAGQPAPQAWYERAIQIADAANIRDEALYWSAQRAELYPSNLGWLGAAQAMKKYGSQEPQDKLDVFRLMARSGALDSDPRFTAREYFDYADVANLRGFYGEAVKVVDKGRSTGALTGNQGMAIRTAANAKIAADQASLGNQERSARAAADGIPAAAVADLYLSFGQAAKAEELYSLALQKGGAKLDRNRALTRLGIAQFDQGKYAQARDNFSKVTGQRQALARLWAALAGQKDPSARRAG